MDEFESFMSRVDLVQSTISGLHQGTVSLDQSERVLARIQPPSPPPTAPIEEHKEQLTFRPGPGVVDDYAHYCPHCRLEHLSPSPTCPQCQQATLPRAARHAQLHAKVQRLQAEKTARRQRRERFVAMKEARKAFSSSSSSTPSPSPLPSPAWDDFEPSSSSDDDDSSSPPSNPAFAALSADLTSRSLRRSQQRSDAERLKALGNAAFTSHNLPLALTHYSAAIDLVRGDKACLANRAAVYVRMGEWEAVVKDCGLVMDVWEYIDRGEERRRERGPGGARTEGEVTVVKALMRRAVAYRAMGDTAKARADLTRALDIEGEGREGKRRAELLRLVRSMEEKEARRAEDARAGEAVPASFPRLVEQLKGDGVVGVGVVKEVRAAIERDDDARAVFRVQGGLAAVLRRLGGQGEDRVGLMALLAAALVHDASKDELVQGEGVELLLSFLHTPLSPVAPLACAALALLTERENARLQLRSTQPPVLDLLLPLLSPATTTPLLIHALSATTNLAYSTPWKAVIRQHADLTPALLRLLRSKEVEVLAPTFSLLANLCTQAASLSLLAADRKVLAALNSAIARVFAAGEGGRREQTSAAAVLLNLSVTSLWTTSLLQSTVQPNLAAMLSALSSSSTSTGADATLLCSRLLALLSKTATDEVGRDRLVQGAAVQSALRLLQAGVDHGDHQRARGGEEEEASAAVVLMESAVKLVASCSQHASFPSLCTPLVPLLPALLSSPSPFLAGNAALVVSALSLHRPLLPSLRACVAPLLRVMREWSGREGKGQADAASNAAVACARLAKDGPNLAVIRAQGGLALLLSAGKRVLT